MPNWVHHFLIITGLKAERERFIAECFTANSDGMNLDFDKLIPQPEHIKESTKGLTNFADEPGSGDLLLRVGNTPGFPAWYEWCCENWGTKWNACYTSVKLESEAITLSFDTAWSPPMPIFDELARRFPQLKIEGYFIEEMHHFGGRHSLPERQRRD
jgi:hypothetical protein